MSEFSISGEERAVLAMTPFAREIAAFVRSRIPEGADWGVLLFAKRLAGEDEGQVIALSSNRDRVAFYAAQWALSVMKNPTKESAVDQNETSDAEYQRSREVVPDSVTDDYAREIYRGVSHGRRALKAIAATLNEARKEIGEGVRSGRLDGEAVANATLAYRHVEDASMRLGKVLQAIDGGVSVYDKGTTVGA